MELVHRHCQVQHTFFATELNNWNLCILIRESTIMFCAIKLLYKCMQAVSPCLFLAFCILYHTLLILGVKVTVMEAFSPLIKLQWLSGSIEQQLEMMMLSILIPVEPQSFHGV